MKQQLNYLIKGSTHMVNNSVSPLCNGAPKGAHCNHRRPYPCCHQITHAANTSCLAVNTSPPDWGSGTTAPGSPTPAHPTSCLLLPFHFLSSPPLPPPISNSPTGPKESLLFDSQMSQKSLRTVFLFQNHICTCTVFHSSESVSKLW